MMDFFNETNYHTYSEHNKIFNQNNEWTGLRQVKFYCTHIKCMHLIFIKWPFTYIEVILAVLSISQNGWGKFSRVFTLCSLAVCSLPLWLKNKVYLKCDVVENTDLQCHRSPAQTGCPPDSCPWWSPVWHQKTCSCLRATPAMAGILQAPALPRSGKLECKS